MKKLALGVAAAATIASGVPATAQKSPEKIKLTAQSRDGAVLIRVPVEPFDYALQFSKNGNSGFLSRVYLMAIRKGSPGYRYIARTLSPGRYRLDSIWQQGAWSAYLEEGTFEFTVPAGRIVYLGTLEAQPVLASIQAKAVAAGRTTMQGTDYMQSHSGNERPIVEGRQESDLAAARQFAEAAMNGSGEIVELAEVKQSNFSTSTVSRAIKVCG